MLRVFFTIFCILTFGSPVAAQDNKVPKIPNYKSWTTQDREAGAILYKEERAVIVVYSYGEKQISGGCLVVFSMPMGKEVFNALLVDNLKILEKTFNSNPWLLIYRPYDCEYGATYVFERSRKRSEFYFLWRPRWRFVKFIPQDVLQTEDDLENFLREKYELDMGP